MPRAKWYTGPVNRDYSTYYLFRTSIEPTQETHSEFMLYAFGGYKTREEALQVANYQGACFIVEGNPLHMWFTGPSTADPAVWYVFRSAIIATADTHGKFLANVWGPYPTKKRACLAAAFFDAKFLVGRDPVITYPYIPEGEPAA